jgi:hypothetical protein
MHAVKTNSEGDSLWADGFSGGPGRSKGFAATETADGGYALAGYLAPLSGQTDPRGVEMLIVRVNADGDRLWTRTCGRLNHNESAHAILETADGGFIVAGGYPYDYPEEGLFLARLEADGSILWTYSADGPLIRVYDLAILEDRSFVVAGKRGALLFAMRFADDSSNYSPPVHDTPEKLVVSYDSGLDNIRLDWSPVTTDSLGNPVDVSYYMVFGSYDSGFEWDYYLGIPNPPDTTFFIDSVLPNIRHRYFYRVKAIVTE